MNDKTPFNFMWKPGTLLLIGSILIIACGMRWNASIAGYLYPVPFLIYARLRYGKINLLLVLIAAFIIEVMKIASEPMYAFIALASGIQSGLIFFGILIAAEWIRTRTNAAFHAPVFALMVAGSEFLGAKFSPLGTWGMMANTQLDNLNFLQIASVTGAAGISFLMAWVSALVSEFIFYRMQGKSSPVFLTGQTAVLASLFFAVHLYGAFRMDSHTEGPTIRAAAVSSKKYTAMDLVQKDRVKAEIARLDNNREVWEKIKNAADMKSRLIVSNEGSLFLTANEEEAMFEKGKNAAKNFGADIVIGYIILRGEGKPYLNKSVWIKSNGSVAQVYHKQFVPPGEPAERVPDKIEAVHAEGYTAGMAICYDFDSIDITSSHGDNGAGLVAIPSADWRGIDPVHTQMTRLRAIEQGYSVIRSVRAAVSAAYDNRGRSLGELSWYSDNDGILLTVMPTVREKTFYSMAGDWFGWSCVFSAEILMLWGLRYNKKLPA